MQREKEAREREYVCDGGRERRQWEFWRSDNEILMGERERERESDGNCNYKILTSHVFVTHYLIEKRLIKLNIYRNSIHSN
jgi:hypothetical protein